MDLDCHVASKQVALTGYMDSCRSFEVVRYTKPNKYAVMELVAKLPVRVKVDEIRP